MWKEEGFRLMAFNLEGAKMKRKDVRFKCVCGILGVDWSRCGG